MEIFGKDIDKTSCICYIDHVNETKGDKKDNKMSFKKISVEQGAINAKRLLDGRRVVDVIPSLTKQVKFNKKGKIENKGLFGTQTELVIGCKGGDKLPDFNNGDAKTIKIVNDKVDESCNITMIQDNVLPEIMEGVNFYDSYVFKKIGKTLFMPINRDGGDENWKNWTYGESFVFSREYFQKIFDEMENDWNHICSRIQYLVKSGQYITSKLVNQGRTVKIIELRTKGEGQKSTSFNHYNGLQISEKSKTYSLYFKQVGLKKIYKEFSNLNS